MGRPKKKVEEVVDEVKAPKPPTKKKKEVRNERDKITRAQAIKLFCESCMGYQKGLVGKCTDQHCELWPFRKGAGQESTEVKTYWEINKSK